MVTPGLPFFFFFKFIFFSTFSWKTGILVPCLFLHQVTDLDFAHLPPGWTLVSPVPAGPCSSAAVFRMKHRNECRLQILWNRNVVHMHWNNHDLIPRLEPVSLPGSLCPGQGERLARWHPEPAWGQWMSVHWPSAKTKQPTAAKILLCTVFRKFRKSLA